MILKPVSLWNSRASGAQIGAESISTGELLRLVALGARENRARTKQSTAPVGKATDNMWPAVAVNVQSTF